MAFGTVGGLVVHQEHILFLASDVRDHASGGAALFHVPDDLRVGFPAVEFRMDERPGLREVEFVGRSFVPEGGKKLAGERDRAHFRPASADVENAVRKFLTSNYAGQVVGGEPYPGRGEVPAPVLVGIPVAVFGTD